MENRTINCQEFGETLKGEVLKIDTIYKAAKFKNDLSLFNIHDIPYEQDPVNDGKKREGQVLIPFPDIIARQLPGSVVKADDFLATLGENNKENINKLIGDHTVRSDESTFAFHKKFKNENFTLSVLNGATNDSAIEISDLAQQLFTLKQQGKAEGDKNYDNLRLQYQLKVAEIITPIFERSRYKEFNGDKVLEINEDCIATGDSLVGVLTMLNKLKGMDFSDRLIKVNVAVATAQGVMILREFAKANNLNMEITAGYLAFGLSKGIKIDTQETKEDVLAHSNYITYTDELLDTVEKRKGSAVANRLRNQEYVVGDMGNNFISLDNSFDDKLPFNMFRKKDPHGPRQKTQGYEDLYQIYLDLNDPYSDNISIYLANGGFFTRAIMEYLEEKNINNDNMRKNYFPLILRASRTLDLEYGQLTFGVFFKRLIQLIGGGDDK